MRSEPRYLVDTDWMVNYLAGRETYLLRFEELGLSNAAISIVTKAELHEGIARSRDPSQSRQSLERVVQAGVSVADLTDPICEVFGRIRGDLRQRRMLIGDFDLIIASTALYYGIPLCTNNRRHFERIEGLQIISIP
jgi:tRNA(fMet)-specific endonuclease VapC